MKGCAPGLVLKQREKATQKWLIYITYSRLSVDLTWFPIYKQDNSNDLSKVGSQKRLKLCFHHGMTP